MRFRLCFLYLKLNFTLYLKLIKNPIVLILDCVFYILDLFIPNFRLLNNYNIIKY